MTAQASYRRSARGWFARSGETQLAPQVRLSGPMPWVIAIMVLLTVIAVAAGLSLRNMVLAAEAELEGGVTIQIVEPEASKRMAETEAAVTALREMRGVLSIRVVPDEEIDALIEPWLGERSEDGPTAIPVPALIDVQFQGGVSEDKLRSARAALARTAPSARADAQASWLRPVFSAIESLQWLAVALVVLLAIALSAAVLLAARNALGVNRDTIEIVHLLGGTDAQIAGAFQRSIGVDAAVGGVVGLILASLVVAFLGQRFAALDAGMVDSGGLVWNDWVMLGIVPLCAVVLAMVTARFTVMHALRKML